MNLKISGRKIAKWVIWSVVIILFLVFFIRVVTFEDNYYSSKEGTERAVTEESSTDTNADLDETEPTDAEVAEYTVAADRPRYLTIEKLGIKKSRVLAMGVNKSGELDTPRNIFDVGWYESSGKPGQGGTMVIDGHNGGPHVYGVFKNLPNLATGDIIQIERGDGVIFKYKVVENTSVDLNDSDAYMSTAMRSPETGIESVTLISCTGEWSQSQGTYLSRQFTRAVIMEN
jgi:LPXTG-site transpeptidase (sortase) family protein